LNRKPFSRDTKKWPLPSRTRQFLPLT
jgi:hypothetical protein